jgi:hypothetical protein
MLKHRFHPHDQQPNHHRRLPFIHALPRVLALHRFNQRHVRQAVRVQSQARQVGMGRNMQWKPAERKDVITCPKAMPQCQECRKRLHHHNMHKGQSRLPITQR